MTDNADMQADTRIFKSGGLESVLAFFERQDKTVVTFLGYSDAGYEQLEGVSKFLEARLVQLDPGKVLINSGATASGIGIVYELAKQRGFVTTGILSTLAKRNRIEPSSIHVDYVFYICDSHWGGFLGDNQDLSPTSRTMVEVSDEIFTIGGGEVTRDETIAAIRAGKPVEFMSAEKNHARAIAEALEAGKVQPNNFLGEAQEAIEQALKCRKNGADQAD